MTSSKNRSCSWFTLKSNYTIYLSSESEQSIDSILVIYHLTMILYMRANFSLFYFVSGSIAEQEVNPFKGFL